MNLFLVTAFVFSVLTPLPSLVHVPQSTLGGPTRRIAQPLTNLYVDGTTGFDGNNCLSAAAA